MVKGKRARAGLAAYTALYIVGFAACYAGMLLSGHSPVWQVDGLMQHYPFMVYIGEWLRETAQSLFSGGGVEMFDFTLGFGEDVLITMNYYGLGDPLLMLVSVCFGGAASEAGYLTLIALRGWCAGLACMALARNRGLDWRQSVYAALLYALSLGLFASAQIRQLMFANPYIHLPLMLLGVEHVFEKKKPWLLSLAVALSALCGFYFLYSNSLLLLIYALVRQFTRGAERPLRTLPKTAGRALGWYLLGVGLAAAVFLPATMGFLKGQRLSTVGNQAELSLRYGLWDYLAFPLALISARGAGAVQFMPVLSLLGAALLILRHRREDRSWIALTAVSVLMLLTPATGWVMNGFSYQADRWAYAMSLMAAMLGGRAVPELFRMSRRERFALGGFAAAVAAYLMLAARTRIGGGGANVAGPLISLALTALALTAYYIVRKPMARRVCAAALAVIVLCNVAEAHLRVWERREPEMMRAGESCDALTGTPFAGLPESGAFGRTDADLAAMGAMINAGATEDVPGTAVYNSTISGNVHSAMADVACAGLLQINAIVGLDDRAALEAVWSVGRQVSPSGEGQRIPYGFEKTGETGNGFDIYENTLALPVGYAMTSVLSEAEYAALPPLEKQWALMQCAVTDGTSLPAADVRQSAYELPVGGVEMENITVDGDVLHVEEGAVIRLTFDAPADCELYLQLDGLAFSDGLIDPGNLVHFNDGAATASVNLMPDTFELDLLDREYYLVNLGWSDEERSGAEITFARTGRYRLTGMRLFAQPMAEFADMARTLQSRGLENVRVGENAVSGTISLEEPAVVVFSIPASDGWRAEVNGSEAALISSADVFLALELGAGDHEITLTYRTPWLIPGAAVTAASALTLAGMLLAGRRRARKETGNEKV